MSRGIKATGGATRWIRLVARIWGSLVLVVALLILAGYASTWITTGQADPYAVEDYPPIENLPPLLMLLAAFGSVIAWRWEGLGGAVTVVCQLLSLPILLVHWPISEDFPRYIIAPYGAWIVVIVPGVLFLLSWWRSRDPTVPARDG